MKRLLFFAAALSIMALIAMRLTQNRKEELLYLGIFPQTKSVLIEPEGTIEVVLFFSRADTMFVQPELIQNAIIEGTDVLTTMEVCSIERTNDEIQKNGRSYFGYRMTFAFGFRTENGFFAEWKNAVLVLSYKEAVRLEIPIGSWTIRVGSVLVESPLSLVRLYGRKGTECGVERVLIGLQNRTDQPLEIVRWHNGDSAVLLRMERFAIDHPLHSVARLEVFGSEIETEPFVIPSGETRYLVVRIVDEQERVWNQFYLEAIWRGMGMTDTFLIDDFVYVAEEGGPCDGDFVEIVIRYPHGRD